MKGKGKFKPSSNRSFWYAGVRFAHDTNDPNDVTKLLLLKPSKIERAGDKFAIEGLGTITTTESFWMTTSIDALSKECGINEHLNFLLDYLLEKQFLLTQLMVEGWRVSIGCHLYPDDTSYTAGIDLTPTELAKLALLKIGFYFNSRSQRDPRWEV